MISSIKKKITYIIDYFYNYYDNEENINENIENIFTNKIHEDDKKILSKVWIFVNIIL